MCFVRCVCVSFLNHVPGLTFVPHVLIKRLSFQFALIFLRCQNLPFIKADGQTNLLGRRGLTKCETGAGRGLVPVKGARDRSNVKALAVLNSY